MRSLRSPRTSSEPDATIAARGGVYAGRQPVGVTMITRGLRARARARACRAPGCAGSRASRSATQRLRAADRARRVALRDRAVEARRCRVAFAACDGQVRRAAERRRPSRSGGATRGASSRSCVGRRASRSAASPPLAFQAEMTITVEDRDRAERDEDDARLDAPVARCCGRARRAARRAARAPRR